MTTNLTKSFDVEQPIDLVWATLTNPPEIVDCVPGASLTEQVDADNYKGYVGLKFGPVKAGYDGLVTFVERDVVNKKMALKGLGLDSKGKGSAEMLMNATLTEVDGHTHVEATMDISITGMLAQFGARLINDVSNQVFDQFVGNFKKKLASAGAATAESATDESTTGIGGFLKKLF
ncbi:SRPBCC family protein [Fibrella aquatilis]|uniref:SRPBCC family protein n=1 Tax=Fibrella aquatilis TaxID=2817059 RepID=A0A939GA85_9BACT|nr:SRPBCC family protein [Fibrella aquatilis]MBO0934108.1 SRPBCC family protein [Fibrella aquatilis]